MPKDCRDTALSYLEHRERTIFELRSHLVSKGFKEDEINEEMNRLEELRYLDDARYCDGYIRYGAGKGRGPVRLQHELAEKGVDPVLIREAIEDVFDRQTERESAMKEAKKLLKDIDSRTDEKTLAKVARKLNALGYHSDVIYDTIRRLDKA